MEGRAPAVVHFIIYCVRTWHLSLYQNGFSREKIVKKPPPEREVGNVGVEEEEEGEGRREFLLPRVNATVVRLSLDAHKMAVVVVVAAAPSVDGTEGEWGTAFNRGNYNHLSLASDSVVL